jgi:hypothetical protein
MMKAKIFLQEEKSQTDTRVIEDSVDLSASNQLSLPQSYPRLCIAFENNIETISFDRSKEIFHVNVPPSAEESHLRNVVKEKHPTWTGSRVYYMSVGQMKHFKIEVISNDQVNDLAVRCPRPIVNELLMQHLMLAEESVGANTSRAIRRCAVKNVF